MNESVMFLRISCFKCHQIVFFLDLLIVSIHLNRFNLQTTLKMNLLLRMLYVIKRKYLFKYTVTILNKNVDVAVAYKDIKNIFDIRKN